MFGRFLRHLMVRGAPRGYKLDTYPNSFNSWLVFKHIENLILWMDGYSFGLLCFRCANFDRYLIIFLNISQIHLFMNILLTILLQKRYYGMDLEFFLLLLTGYQRRMLMKSWVHMYGFGEISFFKQKQI